MTRRAALLLAMLAALHGAPSPLLAAQPNHLSSPMAAPRAGSSRTAFDLSVRYVSAAGNPARRVVAHAGPTSVDLALVSGTALDGTWAGEVQLPAGTWSVTFRAVVDRGPEPSIAGPTLTVTSRSAGSAAPGPGRGSRSGAAGAARSPAPASGGGGAQAPRSGATAPGEGRGEAPSGSRRGTRAASSDGVPLYAPRGAGRGGVHPFDARPGEQEVDDLLLVLGIVVGVAAFVLLMTGWLLAARTRDDGREPAPAEAPRAMRARQRARATGHDPVLAAMGLDDDEAPPPGPDG